MAPLIHPRRRALAHAATIALLVPLCGCASGPDVLRVERRGPDEIAFPGCGEFPSPLKRCTTR